MSINAALFMLSQWTFYIDFLCNMRCVYEAQTQRLLMSEEKRCTKFVSRIPSNASYLPLTVDRKLYVESTDRQFLFLGTAEIVFLDNALMVKKRFLQIFRNLLQLLNVLKMILKMSSAKCRLYYPGLNMLYYTSSSLRLCAHNPLLITTQMLNLTHSISWARHHNCLAD